MAFWQASTASARMLRPESAEYSVKPTPAIAVSNLAMYHLPSNFGGRLASKASRPS